MFSLLNIIFLAKQEHKFNTYNWASFMNLGFCFDQCSDVNLKILNNFIFEILFCQQNLRRPFYTKVSRVNTHNTHVQVLWCPIYMPDEHRILRNLQCMVVQWESKQIQVRRVMVAYLVFILSLVELHYTVGPWGFCAHFINDYDW